MWWDKKQQPAEPRRVVPRPAGAPNADSARDEKMPESIPKFSDSALAHETVLGRSMLLKGDLSGREDLLIEGQFEGSVTLAEHCLTVGPNGQVKGEIQARQVVVQGAVNGNITAREKIEIRKSGRVVGDLVAAGIAIEDGAYFKGSIDIVREQAGEPPESVPASAPSAFKTSA
jgi:cytoskeletal protein CcmA (bactofilin family)